MQSMFVAEQAVIKRDAYRALIVMLSVFGLIFCFFWQHLGFLDSYTLLSFGLTILLSLGLLLAPKTIQTSLFRFLPYFYSFILLSTWVYSLYGPLPDIASHLINMLVLIGLPACYMLFYFEFKPKYALGHVITIIILITVFSLPKIQLSYASDMIFRSPLLVFIILASQSFLALLLFPITRLGAKYQAVSDSATELEHLAFHDDLTKLPNRRWMEIQLYEAMNDAKRFNRSFAIALLDIDHFKTVNDYFGHATGDRVLKDIAHFLQEHLRATDRVCRWGGEEFLLLLRQTDDVQALITVERLREALNQTMVVWDLNITFSGGVTTYNSSGSLATMLERADKALYLAKHSGRNRIESADQH